MEGTDARADFRAPITFEYAYTRWHDYVLRICRAYVRDPDTAEDLTADTFVRAWRVWDRLDADTSFYRWLKQAATHVCGDYYRRETRRRRWSHGWVQVYDPAHDARVAVETAETPLLAHELRRALVTALATCTPDQRAALRLTARGWSQVAIGEALGRSPGAVKLLLHRARGQVRQRVQ